MNCSGSTMEHVAARKLLQLECRREVGRGDRRPAYTTGRFSFSMRARYDAGTTMERRKREMYHPDIDAWLQSRDDAERLKELERRAADAWFQSLSPAQQEVFAALSASHGLNH